MGDGQIICNPHQKIRHFRMRPGKACQHEKRIGQRHEPLHRMQGIFAEQPQKRTEAEQAEHEAST